MKTWKQIALILMAAVIAAVVSAFVHPKRPAWYYVEDPDVARWQITVEKAKELIAADPVVLVDARKKDKYDEEHLPGAILLDTDQWEDSVEAAVDSLMTAFGRPVIVYCDGDRCAKSADVSQRLREQMGLDPVFILNGDWRELVSVLPSAE